MTPVSWLVVVLVGSLAVLVARMTWKVRTASAFLAGCASGAIVALDPSLWVVDAMALVAIAAGSCFAIRTRGQHTDTGAPTLWLTRFGASWLVLSFPALVVWGSFQFAQWLAQRI